MKIRLFVAAALAAGVTSIAAKAGEMPMDRGSGVVRAIAKAEPKPEKVEKSASPRKATAKSSTRKSKVALVARERKKGKTRRAAVDVDTMTTASIQSLKSTGDSAAYRPIIARYASQYSVPLPLAHAVIKVESNYRPGIVGRAGEIGLMQIKPSTARMLGYSGSVSGLHDPETNIRFGMMYLAMAKKLGDGSTCGTILKYNAGHAATRMNPVSSAYCAKVTRLIAGL